jgi:putative ABC transport system ATP-binding protein
VIEGKNLCKSFGEKEIFNNFSFMIDDAEFVCFSGASGKGKTTLLNMIGMIESPTSGKIVIDSHEIRTNKEKLNYYRTKVGFVFQNFALVEGKTVEENLALVRKTDREPISIDEALDKVGIYNKMSEKVYTLSGGEQQRVALARLFIKKCDIILADEPTGSLDSSNASIVIDILKALNEQGKTIVLVTHDNKLKCLCDRVIDL